MSTDDQHGTVWTSTWADWSPMRGIDARPPALPALVVALSISWAGCGEPQVSDGPWVAEVSHIADTTVVRTVSGSSWERPARLVEELRLGSLEEGDALFGSLPFVSVADGRVEPPR